MNRHANLLPAAFRRRLLLRTRFRQWAPVWVLALLAAGGLWWAGQHSLSAQREQLRQLETQAAPLHALARRNTQLRQQLGQFAARRSMLAELEPAISPLRAIGLVSGTTRRGASRVQVRKFSLSSVSTPAVAAAGGNPTPARNLHSDSAARQAIRLQLTGIATDDLAVADFVSGLRDRGPFASVELRSSAVTQLPTIEARAYVIECTFPPLAGQ